MNFNTLSKASTNCITFRIPTEKLNQLHKESETKQVSLNTLINQIIKEDLDWHSVASHTKLYYLPKSFLIRLIEGLNEEDLKKIAHETAKKDLVDISLFFRGGFSIASLSDITETWLRIAQMPYKCEITEVSCKIIIEHNMGSKYSYLIKEISRYLLEVAFEAKSSCNITENAVVIEIEQ